MLSFYTVIFFLRLETHDQEKSSHISNETEINGILLSLFHEYRNILNIRRKTQI
jgi:hypothetical protein